MLIGMFVWLGAWSLVPTKGSAAAGLNTIPASMSSPLLLFLGVAIASGVLAIVKPGLLRNNKFLLLLALLSFLTLLPARAFLEAPPFAGRLAEPIAMFSVPYAVAPLLATILVGPAAGLAVGMWTSIACAVFARQKMAVLITGLVAGMLAARLGHRVRRRVQIFRIGLIIGVAEMLLIPVVLPNAPGQEFATLGIQAVACMASGLSSAIATLLLLPLFEILFGTTTDVTLLELSDLSHPLLQRLAMEAPGTYHHSLLVANLAQAAADEIHANALLARVGSYFHDVGKLTKPGYFVENLSREANPHDNLPPSLSALVIAAHVKEGLGLALLHKLPPPIQDIIAQHHGTGLISFFHHKANQQARSRCQAHDRLQGSGPVDESNFRYPGPKPTSREAAIVMLADAIEAASRSLERPNAAHIQELTDQIVAGRFEDGQLDNSDVSFAEICRIKRAFVFTLTSMLHGRIAYPQRT